MMYREVKGKPKYKIALMSLATAVYLALSALFLHNLFPPTHSSASTFNETVRYSESTIAVAPTALPEIISPEQNRLAYTAPMVREPADASPRSTLPAMQDVEELLTAMQEPKSQALPAGGIETAVPPAPTAAPATFGDLIIPSIGVHHRVTAVPVINGSWDISQLNDQVGHLQTTGTHPQDDLSMTFIGHVTVPWPSTAPFADLVLVEHGDEIIYRWNGNDYIYEVSRILRVDPQDVHILYNEDPSTIQIATCSGWDLLDRQYNKRLITRATLIRVEPTPFQ